MKLEQIDGAEVRRVLDRLGFEPLDGANNDVVEMWIARSGEAVSIPYYRRGDRSSFVKQAYDDILEQALD